MKALTLLLLPLAALPACGDDSGAGGAASTTTSATSTTAAPSATTGATSTTTTATASTGTGGADPTASSGCVDGAGLPEGQATFMLNDVERKYILHLPPGYTKDRKWPVILALHPNGGNIDYWDATDGPRNIRGAAGDDAILVMVEDATNNWPDDLDTELAYFDKILTDVKSELCINTSEIFSMGFSGGGSFSGVLGCRRNDIRAFAAGGAIIYFDPADCTNIPAAWVTIGDDELVPERAEFRDFWRDRATCDETSMPTDPDPCVAYDNCAAATPVQYCRHVGGHEWPDFGTAATWAFFQHFVVE